jgi:lincosamide nucleotidyltransferase A/C/D/E
VYSEPAHQLPAKDAVEILSLLKSQEIEVWVDGGWGVDALLGYQSRAHNDIDLVIRQSDVERLSAALATAGFRRAEEGRPFNFVLADSGGRQIDVHTVVFDAVGNGLYGPQPEEGSGMKYPAAAFKGEGVIGGMRIRCMTAEFQIENRRTVPDERDIHDLRVLRDRFSLSGPAGPGGNGA